MVRLWRERVGAGGGGGGESYDKNSYRTRHRWILPQASLDIILPRDNLQYRTLPYSITVL